MLKKNLLVVFFILVNIAGNAQNEIPGKNWSFGGSYYSLNITNPGIKLSVEHTLLIKERNAVKSLYLSGSLGNLYLPKISYNLFGDLGLGYRRCGRSHFIHGVETGLMYIRTYNYGITYTVSASDVVSEVPPGSTAGIALRLNYELGYMLSSPVCLSMKPGLALQTGHFGEAIPQLTYEICLKYKLIPR